MLSTFSRLSTTVAAKSLVISHLGRVRLYFAHSWLLHVFQIWMSYLPSYRFFTANAFTTAAYKVHSREEPIAMHWCRSDKFLELVVITHQVAPSITVTN